MDEKQNHENEAIQLKLAMEILKEILKPKFDFDSEFSLLLSLFQRGSVDHRSEDDKKTLCQMFSKLYIPDVVDDVLIRRLKLYIDTVKSVRDPHLILHSAPLTSDLLMYSTDL